METAEALVLSRLRWSAFGTLTFSPRDEGMSSGRQKRMFFAFSREVARKFSVYFPSFQWALRMELGEKFGKEHLHCLLGAPIETTTMSQRFWMMDRWEKLGGGMARIFEYDPALAGVDYLCKCLGQERPSGAKVYELNKFGSAEELTLSHAATAAIHASNWATKLTVAKVREIGSNRK